MKKYTQKIINEYKSTFVVMICIFLVLFGYFLGAWISQVKYTNFLKSFRVLRNPLEKTSLVNPLVGSASNPATDVGFYVDEKEEIVTFLEKQKRAKNLDEYSFYVRDLNSGFWFGKNEMNSYFPASLFKLPIAVAVYAQGEENPVFLKKRIVYTQELSAIFTTNNKKAETVLVVGKVYTIEELVEIMLINSDNAAKDTLLAFLDIRHLQAIFNIAHLVDPTKSSTYEISSREYSLFLRVLYGSSFLNEEHSEILLRLLSSATFTQGLVSGVPQNIPVAHKYGVFEAVKEVEGKEVTSQFLHDCGIVYHPNSPYVVCIMTKGKDEKTLSDIISQVSSILYKYKEKENF